jgi:hypothetical protein
MVTRADQLESMSRSHFRKLAALAARAEGAQQMGVAAANTRLSGREGVEKEAGLGSMLSAGLSGIRAAGRGAAGRARSAVGAGVARGRQAVSRAALPRARPAGPNLSRAAPAPQRGAPVSKARAPASAPPTPEMYARPTPDAPLVQLARQRAAAGGISPSEAYARMLGAPPAGAAPSSAKSLATVGKPTPALGRPSIGAATGAGTPGALARKGSRDLVGSQLPTPSFESAATGAQSSGALPASPRGQSALPEGVQGRLAPLQGGQMVGPIPALPTGPGGAVGRAARDRAASEGRQAAARKRFSGDRQQSVPVGQPAPDGQSRAPIQAAGAERRVVEPGYVAPAGREVGGVVPVGQATAGSGAYVPQPAPAAPGRSFLSRQPLGRLALLGGGVGAAGLGLGAAGLGAGALSRGGQQGPYVYGGGVPLSGGGLH